MLRQLVRRVKVRRVAAAASAASIRGALLATSRARKLHSKRRVVDTQPKRVRTEQARQRVRRAGSDIAHRRPVARLWQQQVRRHLQTDTARTQPITLTPAERAMHQKITQAVNTTHQAEQDDTALRQQKNKKRGKEQQQDSRRKIPFVKIAAGSLAGYLAYLAYELESRETTQFVEVNKDFSMKGKVAILIWNLHEEVGAGHMSMLHFIEEPVAGKLSLAQTLDVLNPKDDNYTSFWPARVPASTIEKLLAVTPLSKVLGDGHSLRTLPADIQSEYNRLPDQVYLLDLSDVRLFIKQVKEIQRMIAAEELEYALFPSKLFSVADIKGRVEAIYDTLTQRQRVKRNPYVQHNCATIILEMLKGCAPAVAGWGETFRRIGVAPPQLIGAVLQKQVTGCVQVDPKQFLTLLFGDEVLSLAKTAEQTEADNNGKGRIPTSSRFN